MTSKAVQTNRKYPFGAELLKEGGVDFRLWAPQCMEVSVAIGNQKIPMEKESDGVFCKCVPDAKEGMTYQYQLNGQTLIPDPCSRYQPMGTRGPSLIVNPEAYAWQDASWNGPKGIKGQIFYELHVGTFTREGTWKAAAEKLPYLKELGITIIEMMPVAEWEGKFGWGYDGFLLFAPTANYGSTDELKNFIDLAHQNSLGVILDVVYNHMGPNFDLHKQLAKDYFLEEQTEWGQALNYSSPFVRTHILSNALYWLEEYHFDGLRLDATQNIYDRSEKHILQEISDEVKQLKKERKYLLVGENESQKIDLVENFGFDGIWNDDYHHSIYTALTGKREAYYHDYHGSIQELLSTIKYGFLYQGQYYPWQKKKRGTPALETSHEKFVIYFENHDQVANSTTGQRLHQLCNPGSYRALTTLFLLSPQTPLLFQGQEWGSSKPFYYFADHEGLINRLTWEGRKIFLKQFASFHSVNPLDFPDPAKQETFQYCKLEWNQRDDLYHQHQLNFFRALLQLRKKESLFCNAEKIDGALLNPHLLLVRYFGEDGDDRMIICNVGTDTTITSCSEPLFAPPASKTWTRIFSSQEIDFGGIGTPACKDDEWVMPAFTSYVFGVKSL